MRDGYKLYSKPTSRSTYKEVAVLPTLAEAMANSHFGNPADAYTDDSDWQQTPNDGQWVLSTQHTTDMRQGSPWLIERIQVPESDTDRINLAVDLGFRYGGIDGDHHKMWTIDQMLRTLLGGDYNARVISEKAGGDGPDTYHWDVGIAP